MYNTTHKIKALSQLTGLLCLLGLTVYSQANSSDNTQPCRATVVNSIHPIHWPTIINKQLLDDQCWVTPTQITNWSNIDQLVWIDVRQAKDKKLKPLNRVLSLPITALQDQTLLGDKPIILIGDGFDQISLNKACMQLRKKNKATFALQGGEYSWSLLSKNAALLNEITPAAFLMGSRTIPWKIVTIDLTEKDLSYLPEKPFLKLDTTQKSIQQIVQILNKRSTSTNTFINFVLISTDTESTKQLQQKLTDIKLKNTVWLQGGLQNYQRYVTKQNLIASNAGKILKKPCGLIL